MFNEISNMEYITNAFIEHELLKSMKVNKFIDFILNRSPEITNEDIATMETNGIYLGGGGFAVVVFTSLVGRDITPGEFSGTRNMRSSLLSTTVSRLLTDRYPHYVAEIGGRIVSLLCFTMDSEDSEHVPGIMDSVALTCNEILLICKNEYGFDINATVSRFWGGISNIYRAYTDCMDVLEFYQFRFSRIPAGVYTNQAKLHISVEDDMTSNLQPIARRFSNAITVNDSLTVDNTANELLDFLFTAEPSSLHHLHYRTVLFMTCFLSELTSAGVIDSGYTNNDMIITTLMSSGSEQDYRKKFKLAISDITDYSRKKSENSTIGRIEEVKQYVEDNFSDANLSVTSIADSFGISQPLLSAQFKKYTGTSLSDYIHKQRIQVAHDLIETTKMNITEISESVGYSSIVTMYRAFRRIEGISPGQLR